MFRRSHATDDADERIPVTRERLVSFIRLLEYVRPYVGRMIVAMIALIIGTSLSLLLPLVIRGVVDVVLVEQDIALLNRFTLFLVAIFLLQGGCSFINRYNIAYVGEHVVADLRHQLYAHIMTLSLRFFADRRTGEIVSRVTNDVTTLQTAVTQNLVTLLQQIMLLIGGAFFLFWIDWRLTTIILLGIPVVSLTMSYLGRKIRRSATMVQDSLAEASAVVEETVSGVRIVKSFARENYEISRFDQKIEDMIGAAMYRAKITAILAPTIGFMAFMSITITIWFGSYQVLQGNLSPGDLMAYLIYTLMVGGPIAALSGLYGQFQSALGATQRLFELLDTPADIQDEPQAKPLPRIVGKVTFEQVSFEYDSNLPILHNINLTVEPGQVVALVGPSGAGKSTLVNLIPRFYDVTQGRIMIDGQDIRTITGQNLREQVGIVPQDAATFSGTVADNIRYGNLQATQTEVEAAAQAANAHNFIREMPHGYETLIGERGVKLSGGQRQRVAIARAILKDPRILILDEATSSLDSESERLVQDALDRLMRSRTTFVIAHRLSTIVNADWIVVLQQGSIVEQGRHDSLLALPDGLYRKFHAMQFRFEEETTPITPQE